MGVWVGEIKIIHHFSPVKTETRTEPKETSFLSITPVHPSLFSSSKKMYRRCKSRPGSFPLHADDLNIDIEATHERKTELGKQGKKTKADSEVSTPVLSARLHSIRHLPLLRSILKERSKYFVTFMLKA